MKKSLGTQIAELRKAQGLTQAQLASQLSVTDKAVSKWERDLSCPDITTLPVLAETLGVSVDQLMHAEASPAVRHSQVRETISLILRCIPLAMGTAVTVLSALHQIDPPSALSLLGIGLACLALERLS